MSKPQTDKRYNYALSIRRVAKYVPADGHLCLAMGMRVCAETSIVTETRKRQKRYEMVMIMTGHAGVQQSDAQDFSITASSECLGVLGIFIFSLILKSLDTVIPCNHPIL